jgi:hypothetical protein
MADDKTTAKAEALNTGTLVFVESGDPTFFWTSAEQQQDPFFESHQLPITFAGTDVYGYQGVREELGRPNNKR